MAGADVGGDMAMIQGQNKQTKIQEWTSWKQWALDHKDFEAFKAERIDEPKAHNLKVLEKLKDPKVQKELEPLMEEFTRKDKAANKAVLIGLSIFFAIFFGLTIWAYLDENRHQIFNNNNRPPQGWNKQNLEKE